MQFWLYVILALALAGIVLSASAVGPGTPWLATGVLVSLGGFMLAARSRKMDAPPVAASAPDKTLPQGFGRTLLHQMPAALVVISADKRLTYANPAARTMLPQAVSGMHFSAMIRAPAFVEAIDTILRTREDLHFTFSQVQQRERFFEARASFLPADGARDFGDTAQVLVQIDDRTRDKALLQTRSDFIANASHELRTPLASILGYIETLQGHARDDAEARERFLAIMMKQATRMQRLVDDLMSLSRIEMNAHERPEERVDFYAVAAEAAAALFPVATQHDVLLQIELPRAAAGPDILGDRDQVAQVLVNLVDNAIKYGGSGQKVRVTPAEADPRYPGQLGISVIDQGPGIARENIPRLTERFFRVSASNSKDLGGTGLGLAITKHILARHGGALDIASQPGEGSRFTIWIPQAPDPERDGAVERRPKSYQ